MTKSRCIFISSLIGCSLALFFRSGAIAISPDLSYIQLFGYSSVDLYAGGTQDDPNQMIGWNYVAKPIIKSLYSGLPLPHYTNCSITASGLVNFVPHCTAVSIYEIFPEMTTLFNLLFWSVGTYILLNKMVCKSQNKSKYWTRL